MQHLDPVVISTIVAAAFLPPILYAIYIRNVERHERNPWSGIFRAFLYGAIFSVIIALFLETLVAESLLTDGFVREYRLPEVGPEGMRTILLVVIAAPIVEEFAKGLGVRSARQTIFEIEDGIVYGAAAGLGFSATENLLYEVSSYLDYADCVTAQAPIPTECDEILALGKWGFLGVATLRSLTSTFLHATATGILGYGMARRYLSRGTLLEVIPYYALAVLLHSGFNALAVFFTFGDVPVAGIGLIVLVSALAIRWTIARIRHLDRTGMPAPYFR